MAKSVCAYKLKASTDFTVTGLLTTITEPYARVSMHAVREELLDRQIEELALPLYRVKIPSPCVEETYDSQMRVALNQAVSEGVSCMAFGDLFLQNVRAYRENRLSGTGITPIFPLWERPTRDLANEMICIFDWQRAHAKISI